MIQDDTYIPDYQTQEPAQVQQTPAERADELRRKQQYALTGETTIINNKTYAKDNAGQWVDPETYTPVDLEAIRNQPPVNVINNGPTSYGYEPSPTGVRIFNPQTGISEIGVQREGRWIPKSIDTRIRQYEDYYANTMRGVEMQKNKTPVVVGGGPIYDERIKNAGFTTTTTPDRSWYTGPEAVITTAKGGDNYGRELHDEPVAVIDKDFPAVYSPGYMGGMLAYIDGKAVTWGRYDPSAKVLRVSVPLEGIFSNIKEGASGPAQSFQVIDLGFGKHVPKDLTPVNTNGEKIMQASILPISDNMASRLGNDAWNLVNMVWPKNAPIREWVTPSEFQARSSIFDASTGEGRQQIRDMALMDAIGLAGAGELQGIKGISLTQDIIPRIPGVNVAYKKSADIAGGFAGGLKNDLAARLNSIGMGDMGGGYVSGAKAGNIMGKIKPEVANTPDLSLATHVGPGYSKIIESGIKEQPHSIFGGITMQKDMLRVAPRTTRDIDLFIENPDMFKSQLKSKMGGVDIEGMIDPHHIPVGYPIKGAKQIATYDAESNIKVPIGTRLFGNPLREIPDSSQVVTKNGLTHETLDFSLTRKYNAVLTDISNLDRPKMNIRLGKDVVDADRLYMNQMLVQKSRLQGMNPVSRAVWKNRLTRAEIYHNNMMNTRVDYTLNGATKRMTLRDIGKEYMKESPSKNAPLRINIERQYKSPSGLLESKSSNSAFYSSVVSNIASPRTGSGSRSPSIISNSGSGIPSVNIRTPGPVTPTPPSYIPPPPKSVTPPPYKPVYTPPYKPPSTPPLSVINSPSILPYSMNSSIFRSVPLGPISSGGRAGRAGRSVKRGKIFKTNLNTDLGKSLKTVNIRGFGLLTRNSKNKKYRGVRINI